MGFGAKRPEWLWVRASLSDAAALPVVLTPSFYSVVGEPQCRRAEGKDQGLSRLSGHDQGSLRLWAPRGKEMHSSATESTPTPPTPSLSSDDNIHSHHGMNTSSMRDWPGPTPTLSADSYNHSGMSRPPPLFPHRFAFTRCIDVS